MARKRPSNNVNRLLLARWGHERHVGDRLWDRAGRLWLPVGSQLTINEAKVLFFDPTAGVVIHEPIGLRWLDTPRAENDWRALSARTLDGRSLSVEDVKNPMPYEARQFESDGDRLILFDELD